MSKVEDVNKLDVDMLRRLYFFTKFHSLFGSALENHFFSDDLEKAKKIKLKDV